MTVSLRDKWMFLGAVMADPKLPGSARSVAYFMLNHLNTATERCDPSLIGLAEQMGMSERSALTGIEELIKRGYFERISRGGGGVNSKYRACWERLKQASLNTPKQTADIGEERLKQSVEKTEVSRQKRLKQASYETGNINREESGNLYIHESDFQIFWQHYPRKVAQGAARKAYAKALKKTDVNTILNGAMRYAAERADQDPQFTKHPSTWLNGECWNDEPTPTTGKNDGERTHGKRPSAHEALLAGAAQAARRNGD